jgi:2,3-bisphosphoglycerate-independent phosphoglycerate mutase
MKETAMNLDFLRGLITPAETKIVMLILDGLGGLPMEVGGKTELETARISNLDALAGRSALGLLEPAGPGITVESGPGHLALFGYDPFQYTIGRGVLEAIGVGIDLGPGDVAVRGNYCRVDGEGRVTDRRAGRIPDEISRSLSELLTTRIEDVDILVRTVREHRLAIRLRGPGLSAEVTDSDPLKNGRFPLPLQARQMQAEKTASVVKRFVEYARKVMEKYVPRPPANMLLLRGFDTEPQLPSFPEIYGVRSAAIAVYPTYRGIAKLVGMQLLPVEGETTADEFTVLEKYWKEFDFFYLHIKETDLAGEDGDFARKVEIIERVDEQVARLMALSPDVIIVSGDHSTPAALKGHSWHPVPALLFSRYVRADGIAEFGERVCGRGSLGLMPAKNILPLAMANAGRITKWGG